MVILYKFMKLAEGCFHKFHDMTYHVRSSMFTSPGPVSPTWPEGNYAVPVPIFGCGDPETNHWQTGYINITFKQQINLFTRNNLQENKDETLLLGPYSAHSLQMNFCSKQSGSQTLNDIDQTGVKWPPGNYSVYGMNNTCPTGMLFCYFF